MKTTIQKIVPHATDLAFVQGATVRVCVQSATAMAVLIAVIPAIALCVMAQGSAMVVKDGDEYSNESDARFMARCFHVVGV